MKLVDYSPFLRCCAWDGGESAEYYGLVRDFGGCGGKDSWGRDVGEWKSRRRHSGKLMEFLDRERGVLRVLFLNM